MAGRFELYVLHFGQHYVKLSIINGGFYFYFLLNEDAIIDFIYF